VLSRRIVRDRQVWLRGAIVTGLGALALFLTSAPVPAATSWYVATNGSNTAHASWSTAFTNIQDALNTATNGDTIYLAGQTFALSNQVVWLGDTNVAIRGSYAATNDADQPGHGDGARWPTVLVRTGGAELPHLVGRQCSERDAGADHAGRRVSDGQQRRGDVHRGVNGHGHFACIITNNALGGTDTTDYGGRVYSSGSIGDVQQLPGERQYDQV